jgi:tRNA pseudouridine38-40 synthase
MPRYKIILEYDGTNYCGWQRQAEDPSIQEVLENALVELNQQIPVTVYGAGRTDSGVHALGQVAHFELEIWRSPEVLCRALNAKIPSDIVILNCEEVDMNFHARYSAKCRTYLFQILRRVSAIHRYYSWQLDCNLDYEKLTECAHLLLGEHDFSAFCSTQTESENKLSTIYRAAWLREGDWLKFRISAIRFLHSMVRMLVGTMIEIARGRYTVVDFEQILNQQVATPGVYTAPPQGLFLENIEY